MKTAFIRLPQPIVIFSITLLALALLLSLRFYLIQKDALATLSPALFGKSIVIDPGHGGWDPGMKGASGSLEADINLEIAHKLAEYCREAGATVNMTRESNMALATTKAEDMAKRVEIANTMDADIFISIHCNSYPGQSGAQVFYEKGNSQGKYLAEAIQENIRSQLNNSSRQALPHADAYLLHEISCAAVICEAGFLSNVEEESWLNDNTYQWDMAWAFYTGLVAYLADEKNLLDVNP